MSVRCNSKSGFLGQNRICRGIPVPSFILCCHVTVQGFSEPLFTSNLRNSLSKERLLVCLRRKFVFLTTDRPFLVSTILRSVYHLFR